MFDLSSIKSSKKDRPPRILLHGDEKVGKTTFATKFPGVIMLNISGEEGADEFDVPAFPTATKFEQILEAIQTLAQQEHEFKTLVIDSLTALEPLVQKFVCQEGGKASIEDFGFGKGYKKVAEVFDRLKIMLDHLRNEKDMGIIVIAHTKVDSFNDPAGDMYNMYVIDADKRVSALLQKWADCILFAKKDVVLVKDGEGFKETMKARKIEHNLYTKAISGAFPAGCRGKYGLLPAKIKLNYDVWKNEVDNATQNNKMEK